MDELDYVRFVYNCTYILMLITHTQSYNFFFIPLNLHLHFAIQQLFFLFHHQYYSSCTILGTLTLNWTTICHSAEKLIESFFFILYLVFACCCTCFHIFGFECRAFEKMGEKASKRIYLNLSHFFYCIQFHCRYAHYWF